MCRRTLALSSTQRATLIHLRDHDPRPYLRERAAALLQIAAGQAPYTVARHGLHKPRHPDTVYRWLNQYQQHGVTGLHGIRRARWRLRDLRQVVPWRRRYTILGLCQSLTALRRAYPT